MEDKIRKILSYSVLAPSGENSQPWRFLIKDNSVLVYNDPKCDESLYNVDQVGSYIAHGTMLENFRIAASHYNLEVKIELFSDAKEPNYIAKIILEEKKDVVPDPLFPNISNRVSDRKALNLEPLEQDILKKLEESVKESNGASLILTNDRLKIDLLAKLASNNEKILFENKYIHNFFFSHIRWTKEEDNKEPNGFFVDTLELNMQELQGFKIFKHWTIVKILNKFGVSKVVAKANEQKYAASGAMGIFILPNNQKESFVKTGIMTERLWLTATRLGLHFQPMTGLLCVFQGLDKKQAQQLSEKHKGIIRKTEKKIKEVLGIDTEKTIIMLFRVGKGEGPSARSSRFPLEHFLIK